MNEISVKLLKSLSISFVGMWFGQALYINIAESSAIEKIDVHSATAYFPILWPKAGMIVGPTSMSAFGLMLLTWYVTWNIFWLFGAMMSLIATLFTIFILLPTINILRDPFSQGLEESKKRALLNKFYSLSHMRTYMSGIGLVFCLWASIN